MTNVSAHPSANHAKLGVLVVNLGTPAAPTPKAVRAFLNEFLSDRRVVEIPRLLWWLILRGFILPFRSPKTARSYAQIWTPQGSPLLTLSQALTDHLRARLRQELGGEVWVALGMTYGDPSVAQALRTLREQNITRLIVLPLYPQYSGSTTGAVFDRVTRELQTWRALPELHFITHYYDQADYIRALTTSVIEHWRRQERNHLVFSFHGVPQKYIDKGDPYYAQCQSTAQQTAEQLQLKNGEWSIAFQSRLGRARWLQPYLDQLLKDYARRGIKRVTVVSPAFAVDCLETLEEIALRNRADFLAAGGESFNYVPALNSNVDHIDALANLIKHHAHAGATPLPFTLSLSA